MRTSLVFALFYAAAPALAQDAARAHEILVASCLPCHGQPGAAGGFQVLVPSEARVGLIREHVVVDKDMPPAQYQKRFARKYKVSEEALKSFRLSDADRATLKAWLDAGAPGPGPKPERRKFLSDTELLELALQDAKTVAPKRQATLRYLSLANLYNAGDSINNLTAYRNAVVKTMNSLTWQAEPIAMRPIKGSRGALYRITLDEFGRTDSPWNADTWKAIVRHYPYAIDGVAPKAIGLEAVLKTKVGIVRADWFVFAVTRPPLYERLLGLPKSVGELEELIGVDVAGNIKKASCVRAGTTESGVSRNHRVLERHALGSGAYWVSYDFRSPSKPQQDILAHPLGPGPGDGVFAHAGNEIIFSLPNGFQGYFLADAAGRYLPSAPTEIVQNPNRPDAVVINGISCMECHNEGMIDIKAQLRDFAEAFPVSPERISGVRRLYVGKEAIGERVEEDRQRFLKAMERAAVQVATNPAGEAIEPIRLLVDRFADKVDFVNAAAELGMTTEQLRAAFKSPLLSRVSEMRRLEARLRFTRVSRDDFVREFRALLTRLGVEPRQFMPLPSPIVPQLTPEQTAARIDQLRAENETLDREVSALFAQVRDFKKKADEYENKAAGAAQGNIITGKVDHERVRSYERLAEKYREKQARARGAAELKRQERAEREAELKALQR